MDALLASACMPASVHASLVAKTVLTQNAGHHRCASLYRAFVIVEVDLFEVRRMCWTHNNRHQRNEFERCRHDHLHHTEIWRTWGKKRGRIKW